MNFRSYLILIALLAIHTVDLITTAMGIQAGAVEFNPLLAGVVMNQEWLLLAFVKLLAIGGIMVCYEACRDLWPRLTLTFIWLYILTGIGVISWNTMTILGAV